MADGSVVCPEVPLRTRLLGVRVSPGRATDLEGSLDEGRRIVDELYQRKRNELRKSLSELGARIDGGDDSNLWVWVIPGKLACAHRPLRHHPNPDLRGSGRNLPATATPEIMLWMKRIRDGGFKSILCLMHPKEISHYQALDLGVPTLIDFYGAQGMSVLHLPWDDPAHRPAAERGRFKEELERVQAQSLQGFGALEKPVLLHCSAGIDRSSPVAAYIWRCATKVVQPEE